MALRMNNKITSVICQAMCIPMGMLSPMTGIKNRSTMASSSPTVMYCLVFSLIYMLCWLMSEENLAYLHRPARANNYEKYKKRNVIL